MKKLISLLTLLFILETHAKGFKINKRKEKNLAVLNFIGEIETKNADKAKIFLAPYLEKKKIKECHKNIDIAISEISKYTKTCNLSVMETGDMDQKTGEMDSILTFVCRYTSKINIGVLFQLNISFNRLSESLFINNIVLYDEKELLKQKEYNMKELENEPPPPPPIQKD